METGGRAGSDVAGGPKVAGGREPDGEYVGRVAEDGSETPGESGAERRATVAAGEAK